MTDKKPWVPFSTPSITSFPEQTDPMCSYSSRITFLNSPGWSLSLNSTSIFLYSRANHFYRGRALNTIGNPLTIPLEMKNKSHKLFFLFFVFFFLTFKFDVFLKRQANPLCETSPCLALHWNKIKFHVFEEISLGIVSRHCSLSNKC